jgi:orotate phosphoribosyltransferase
MASSAQQAFIDFAIDCGILKFGDFTLKSGRQSPYFFNLGEINSGPNLALLGRFYAAAIAAMPKPPEILFGPAYKGIPLATSIAIALAEQHNIEVGVSFNRKEAKAHGEGGQIMGRTLQGEVLIVDDVISSGMSALEALGFIEAAGAQCCGVLVALDREERGREDGRAASLALAEACGAPVTSLVSLNDIFGFLSESETLSEHAGRIAAYRNEFGGTR